MTKMASGFLGDFESPITRAMKASATLPTDVFTRASGLRSDALDAQRAAEEVRFLEELLASSEDEGARSRGFRGMSEEQLAVLGDRLIQLPVATLTLVLLMTLVSHPVLVAYLSAALVAMQARGAALRVLRGL